MNTRLLFFFFFFFNDTATTEIYTLSLHDALPICFGREHHAIEIEGVVRCEQEVEVLQRLGEEVARHQIALGPDRKSTRLNSSHLVISYAVFCLKKKT